MKKGIWKLCSLFLTRIFPDHLSGKESACKAGDTGDESLIAGSGRSPGEGRGNPLQRSSLENPMDRGDWWATVHGVAKSPTWLSTHTCVSNKYLQFYSWHREELTFVELDLGHLNLCFSNFKAINPVNVYWPPGLKHPWMKAQPLCHGGDSQRWQGF